MTAIATRVITELSGAGALFQNQAARFDAPAIKGFIGLVVTSGPKVTLRNTFYINQLFGTFCYKQLK